MFTWEQRELEPEGWHAPHCLLSRANRPCDRLIRMIRDRTTLNHWNTGSVAAPKRLQGHPTLAGEATTITAGTPPSLLHDAMMLRWAVGARPVLGAGTVVLPGWANVPGTPHQALLPLLQQLHQTSFCC